jgi:hypothetical protein
MRIGASKRCLLFTAVFLLTAMPAFTASADGIYEKWLNGENLADTFEDLLVQYDSSSCEGCHADITEQWKKSFHSRSLTSSAAGIATYLTVGISGEWNRRINRAEAAKCLDCHIPQIDTATDKLAKEIADMVITAGGRNPSATDDEKKFALDRLSKLDINCIICHNQKAIMASPAYLGSKHKHVKTPTDKDKRLGLTARVFSSSSGKGITPHDVEQTRGMTTSLFCEQCHGIRQSPDGERIQCNGLSGSYEDSYRTRGGYKQCQDCHMRDQNRGHSMPGGHDEGILKDGMTLDMTAAGLCRLEDNKTAGPWKPAAIADVRITSNAGHRIPDG